MEFTADMVEPLRKKMGLTQEEFAQKVKCGVRSISLWETGKVKKMQRTRRETLIRMYKRAYGGD